MTRPENPTENTLQAPAKEFPSATPAGRFEFILDLLAPWTEVGKADDGEPIIERVEANGFITKAQARRLLDLAAEGSRGSA